MSVYTTYNTIIEQKIANSSELFLTNEMKQQAVNDAIKDILQKYDLPQFRVRSTITFSDGKVNKPENYLRMIKLWDVNSDGVQTHEFNYRPEDEFDGLGKDSTYWWTEDYDADEEIRRLFVKPVNTGEVQIRYVKRPVDITGENADSGLSSDWDECVALGAVSKLLGNEGRYNEAQVYQAQFERKIAEVYLSVKDDGGFKRGKRIKSRYERIPLNSRH